MRLIALLLLASVGGAFAQSHEPTPSEQGSPEQAQTPNTQGVPQPPAPVAPRDATTVVNNNPTYSQHGDSEPSAADWGALGLTAVIAIATIWLAFTAFRQFKTQTAQTGEALRLTRETNEAASTSPQWI